MEIRQAQNKDVEGILKLQLETAAFHRRLDENYEFRENIATEFKAKTSSFLADEKAAVQIALVKGEIIGYAIGVLSDENTLFKFPKYGMIEEAGVTEKYRSRGYGELVVASLFEWFRSKGVEEVKLKVHVKNNDGIQFWERIGFEKEMYAMRMKL